MDRNIEIIFRKNVELIEYIDKAITYYRSQNYTMALKYTKSIIEIISSVVEPLIQEEVYFMDEKVGIDVNSIMSILGNLLEVQEKDDYILLADIYEAQLVPFLMGIQETIIGKEEFSFKEANYMENLKAISKKNSSLAEKLKSSITPMNIIGDDYLIEYTSSGLMTLALKKQNQVYYLHSNNRVMQEAFALAKEWQEDGVYHYIVYGLGLGYHIKELAELNPEAMIDVYESDLNVIQLACGFTDFKKVVNLQNVTIVYDPDFGRMSSVITQMDQETSLYIHYPSLTNIKENQIKVKLEEYFMQRSSVKNQIKYLNDNFKNNIQNYDYSVDELSHTFKGKDLYIIAAGPSLDKNCQELKKIGLDGIILSTGTVLRKLLQEGIQPDYFIATDATQASYAQFEGIEQIQIPFIGMSTVYKDFMKSCKGKKYIVCQNGFQKAEEFAKKMKYHLYNTGGSVTTCALDIGIQMNCRRIIFVGLDLAYTNQVTHATSTLARENIVAEKSIQVEDINGNLINTSHNLNIYRQWIEKRIAGVTGVDIIDATEGGAKIKGMKIQSLADSIGVGTNMKGEIR